MATLQSPVPIQPSRLPSLKKVSSKPSLKIPTATETTRTIAHYDNKKFPFGVPRNDDNNHTPVKQIGKIQQNGSIPSTPLKFSKLSAAPLTTAENDKSKIESSRPPLTRSHSAKESISSDDTLSSNGKKSSRTSPNVIPTETLDFSHVKSRIGSLENANHKPKESKKKIFSEKPNFTKVPSRVGSLENIRHTPKASDLKIYSVKPDFSKTHSRVGSFDNFTHTPKVSNVKIYSNKPTFSHVTSRVGSLDNIDHVPGGGEKYVPITPVKISKTEVKSKVGSFDNIKHTPRGGDVKIFNQKPNFRVTATPKIKIRTRSNSITSSGSSVLNEDGDRKSLVNSPVSSFTLDEEVNSPPPERNIPLIPTTREHYPIEEVEEIEEIKEVEEIEEIEEVKEVKEIEEVEEIEEIEEVEEIEEIEEVEEVDEYESFHPVDDEKECEEEYEEAIPVVLSNDNLSFEVVETNSNSVGNDNGTTGVNSQLNDVDLSFEVNVLRKSVLLASLPERSTIEYQSSALAKRLSAIEIPPQTEEIPHQSELTFTQKQAYDESWI